MVAICRHGICGAPSIPSWQMVPAQHGLKSLEFPAPVGRGHLNSKHEVWTPEIFSVVKSVLRRPEPVVSLVVRHPASRTCATLNAEYNDFEEWNIFSIFKKIMKIHWISTHFLGKPLYYGAKLIKLHNYKNPVLD